jgi:hypothetical protein
MAASARRVAAEAALAKAERVIREVRTCRTCEALCARIRICLLGLAVSTRTVVPTTASCPMLCPMQEMLPLWALWLRTVSAEPVPAWRLDCFVCRKPGTGDDDDAYSYGTTVGPEGEGEKARKEYVPLDVVVSTGELTETGFSMLHVRVLAMLHSSTSPLSWSLSATDWVLSSHVIWSGR